MAVQSKCYNLLPGETFKQLVERFLKTAFRKKWHYSKYTSQFVFNFYSAKLQKACFAVIGSLNGLITPFELLIGQLSKGFTSKQQQLEIQRLVIQQIPHIIKQKNAIATKIIHMWRVLTGREGLSYNSSCRQPNTLKLKEQKIPQVAMVKRFGDDNGDDAPKNKKNRGPDSIDDEKEVAECVVGDKEVAECDNGVEKYDKCEVHGEFFLFKTDTCPTCYTKMCPDCLDLHLTEVDGVCFASRHPLPKKNNTMYYKSNKNLFGVDDNNDTDRVIPKPEFIQLSDSQKKNHQMNYATGYLGEKSLVESNHLNLLLELLLQHGENVGKVAFFNPEMFKQKYYFVNSNICCPSYTEDIQKLAFFVNENSNHWVIYLFDKETKSIKYINTILNKNGNQRQPKPADLKQVRQHITDIFDLKASSNTEIVKIPKEFIQTDEINCGVLDYDIFHLIFNGIDIEIFIHAAAHRILVRRRRFRSLLNQAYHGKIVKENLLNFYSKPNFYARPTGVYTNEEHIQLLKEKSKPNSTLAAKTKGNFNKNNNDVDCDSTKNITDTKTPKKPRPSSTQKAKKNLMSNAAESTSIVEDDDLFVEDDDLFIDDDDLYMTDDDDIEDGDDNFELIVPPNTAREDIFTSTTAKAAGVLDSDTDDIKLIKLLIYLNPSLNAITAFDYIYIHNNEIKYAGFTNDLTLQNRRHEVDHPQRKKYKMLPVIQNIPVEAAADFEPMLIHYLLKYRNCNLENIHGSKGVSTFFTFALFDEKHPSHERLINGIRLLVEAALTQPADIQISSQPRHRNITFTTNHPLHSKINVIHGINEYTKTGCVYALTDKNGNILRIGRTPWRRILQHICLRPPYEVKMYIILDNLSFAGTIDGELIFIHYLLTTMGYTLQQDQKDVYSNIKDGSASSTYFINMLNNTNTPDYTALMVDAKTLLDNAIKPEKQVISNTTDKQYPLLCTRCQNITHNYHWNCTTESGPICHNCYVKKSEADISAEIQRQMERSVARELQITGIKTMESQFAKIATLQKSQTNISVKIQRKMERSVARELQMAGINTMENAFVEIVEMNLTKVNTNASTSAVQKQARIGTAGH